MERLTGGRPPVTETGTALPLPLRLAVIVVVGHVFIAAGELRLRDSLSGRLWRAARMTWTVLSAEWCCRDLDSGYHVRRWAAELTI
jgi:hypothetical protein